VPWLIVVCLARRSLHAHLAGYVLGVVYYAFHLSWLANPTLPGYVAAVLLYMPLFFVIPSWVIRHVYRHRGLPLVIVFPVVWTAFELLRAHGPLAFPWFLLGHTQIRLLSMIQVADLGGAFIVSFVVAMVNGWLADRMIYTIRHRKDPSLQSPPWIPLGAIAVVLVVGLTMLYGWYRLNYRKTVPGPVVSVVQGDFLLQPEVLIQPRKGKSLSDIKREKYMALLDETARSDPKPELVVLPETPWSLTLNREYYERSSQSRRGHDLIQKQADSRDVNIVIGAQSYEYLPKDSRYRYRIYNSAFFYRPGVEGNQRYDKIHLVPFGEVVPFYESERFHWVYRLLNDGPWNPWGGQRAGGFQWPSFPLNDWKPFGDGGFDYSCTYGKEYNAFELESESSKVRPARFGITICYEDVMPQVFRRFILDEQGNKRVDFMLNISNDGWFSHGRQQAQHLVSCAFRAVENRVPVARSVNTGISGFVETDGSWRGIITGKEGHLQAGGEGYRTARLQLDSRITFYSRHGDLFAILCLIWAAGGAADASIAWVAHRRLVRRTSKQGEA
jgi:apolipoprotein N-acyltransferase